ncbi:MAG: helix-turn-helix domain-containing protein [Candidatus Methanomethylophilaceae archaeon]|nr:helix-turn-helix domain-containing protein [Candidatus Methanomethylophilaceae archaeon]
MCFATTKKSPGKREQRRFKKIEDERQSLRYKAADLVGRGRTYRSAAKLLGVSHQFVCNWARRLLDSRTVSKNVHGKVVQVREYVFKEDWRELIRTRKPGPRTGRPSRTCRCTGAWRTSASLPR